MKARNEISAEEYRRLQAGGKRRSKYNAKRTEIDTPYGKIKFDSKKEAARYQELLILQKMGNGVRVFRQVPFDLPGGVKYRLDFLVLGLDGGPWYIDVKGGPPGNKGKRGTRTDTYIMKKKQVEELYKVKITEV